MITLISGTDRNDSNTLRIAQHYYNVLMSKGVPTNFFSLKDHEVYNRSEDLIKAEQEWLIPSDKFIFVVPEYNGSFPGILKTMIDHTDIRKAWWQKKALLVGLASGRGGNARGLDHLSNILHYLKVHVHYNKLPISKIQEELDLNGQLKNAATLDLIQYQIEDFLEF
jgi:chromate reductase